MLRLHETATGLMVYTPTWIGGVAVLLGVALAGYVVLRRPLGTTPVDRRALGKAFGAIMAALILFYAGWTWLASSTSFERGGVVVNGRYGEEERVGWSQVERHKVEERSSGRGGRSNHLVLYLRNGDEIAVGISGLPAEQAVRVLDFVKVRAPAS